MFDKGVRNTQGKDISSINGAGKTGHLDMEEDIGPLPHTIYENQLIM